MQKNQILGVILAGGLSRRMGGGDKGLLDLGGASMIGRVIERLAPQVADMAINANGDPARFRALGLPVIPDRLDGFVGPLAGVHAGMLWAAAQSPDVTHIVTVSSDAPFLPENLVQCLIQTANEHPGGIALAASAGELHPVIGLWPVNLAADLEAELTSGVRKVLRWTDKHGTHSVEFPFIEAGAHRIDPFFNANTPEELDEARRLLALLPA